MSDEEILEAYRLMARKEGIFCEPASAAALAGLLKRAREGCSFEGKKVVCIVTGSGLKDPDVAAENEPTFMEEYPAELSAVERALVLD